MKADQGKASDQVSSNAFFDREVGWLRRDARSSRWITLAGLCAFVLYLAVIAALAAGPINIFHNDALIFLDSAWRVLNGQVVHRDFYSPLGPLEYWIVAGGMLLVKGGPKGIAIGTAVFGLITGVWGWLLCRRHLPALFSLLVVAWIVLILLGLLKLNFFGVAALLLLLSVLLTRAEASRLRGLLAGAGATCIALLIYPGFSYPAFFTDMSYAIRARGSTLTIAGTGTGIIECAQSGIVWIVAVIAVGAVWLTPPARRWHRENRTLAVLSLIVLASGPLFIQTNALENSCELAPLWIIILLDRVSSIHLLTENKIATVPLIALGLGSIAAVVSPDVLSAFTLIRFRSPTMMAQGSVINAPGMQSMRFYDSTSFYVGSTATGDGDGHYYADCLNDGLTLLAHQSTPEESILTLGFHNPFSYLLHRRPAEGGSSFLLVGNSIPKAHMPSEDKVFGNADLIMLPEYEGTHRSSDIYIQNYYRPRLSQDFRFVARSKFWLLYRRNK
jgi:hypothetical protein